MTLSRRPFDEDGVRTALRTALPAYLPTQRWFGDKARAISAVEIAEAIEIPALAHPAAYVVLDVVFGDGGTVRYGLPLAIGSSGESGVICSVDAGDGYVPIRDALLEQGFRDWVLRLLVEAMPVQAGAGRLIIDRPDSARQRLSRLIDAQSRVLGAEQSNSSLVFGDDAFVKLFRRLQPGINPDVELTRFLSVKAGFDNTPEFLGSVSYESDAGNTTVIAVAQAFTESIGDGWTYVLHTLENQLRRGGLNEPQGESALAAKRLGDVTANMHLALASDPWDPQLAPEPIRQSDTERWKASYLAMLDTVVDGTLRARSAMDARTAELASAFADLSSGLRDRANGFDRLLGRTKTRVHGDYHLGQLLRTVDEDFVVIDFEGEPQRSIEERRLKTSPLKDVAGMLRSFAYARGTISAKFAGDDQAPLAELVSWERLVRSEFLNAYLRTASDGGATFLPSSPDDIDAAIAAWELDKIVYEVQYELNNRPDWLWIPLSGMLKYGTPNA